MAKYIDKSALVAEIEKIEEALKNACEPNPFGNMEECMTAAEIEALNVVKAIINTLEVKEVDLKKEIYDAEKRFGDIDEMGGYRILIFDDDFRDILRHFFELGLKAQKGE